MSLPLTDDGYTPDRPWRPVALPLVYSTKQARSDAERLLPPGSVLENEVEQAILDGRVAASTTGGLVFDSDHRWVAIVKRVEARTQRGRRAWLTVSVRRYVPTERRPTVAAPGITNDPRGTQDTPRSGIASIDANVRRLQAEDTARLAAANRQVEAERPTPQAPNTRPGG